MTFVPKYQITNKLLKISQRISVLTAELNRKKFPAPVLVEFERRAITLSAHASTRIEGNPLALTEVKRLLKNLPSNLKESEREVVNYNAALKLLRAALQKGEQRFSLTLVLDIHNLVMKDLLEPYFCGRIREEPVVVSNPRTGQVVYLPPDAKDVQNLLDDCIHYINAMRENVDPLILAGLFHRQFVIIHPFIDGNGRTARLATKVLLASLGLNTFSLFSFENFYNNDISRYLAEVGMFGNFYEIQDSIDFSAWLEYFAEGVFDELQRVSQEIERAQASPTNSPKPHHKLILKHIQEHGFITDRDYSKLTDRAKATRALDFKRLMEWGMIVRLGRGKNTHYKLGE